MYTAHLLPVTSTFPETTFTEMFCPDWKNESIFLSHMGEVNVDLIAEKPKLINEQRIFDDSKPQWKIRRHSVLSMRISPDGKSLLYS